MNFYINDDLGVEFRRTDALRWSAFITCLYDPYRSYTVRWQ